MKNSILTLLAVAAMLSCNKKDTVSTDNSVDSTDMSSTAPMDSPQTLNDSATVSSTGTDANSLSTQDKSFVDAAAKGGMMEVMMGELAAVNASNASVKSLGKMIAKDHKMANDELKKWAAAANYSLPSTMDASQQKMHDDLKAKKGADFDKAYVDMMVNDHKKDIAAFKIQSKDGTDVNLKAFATKTLPTLENHMMESEKVKSAMK
ncbi:DUF4142 domain-containing protein [Chryseobacterium indoltheticum]|jgi:putative membrane protein|uniref:DUF4142 domain-containing protein n=1 Tax=Chryseobacterium indoltheticum TaxID=254 RepID=UPI001914A19C|nr:DUF4142 domain-containing protein [Chryseobacterium indoltheticum]QQQ29152.1 DUF4142 domain-containing protein [Chryseobacterium indoltheticum]